MDDYTARFDIAFNKLPVELNQLIARGLDTDKDIVAFRASCIGAKNAIDADNGSFWREKFRETFALRSGRTSKELQETYQDRMKWLKRGTGYDFHWGHSKKEQDVVRILRDIIIESFQGVYDQDSWARPRCINQDVLLNFVKNSKIVLHPRRPGRPPRKTPGYMHPELAAVKLMCSHFLFELDNVKHGLTGMEESQYAVYLATNKAPLYGGPTLTELNMQWFLHCMNFFRHHMLKEDVGTLYEVLKDLSAYQIPSAWQDTPRSGTTPLGKHWKGTYAFLDHAEIGKLRRLSTDQLSDGFFPDKNVDEGKIQSLQLEFVEGKPLRWPKLFEEHLSSLRNVRPKVKAQGRTKPSKSAISGAVSATNPGNLQFTGSGIDLDEDFKALGWLNPLPDQHGIPGWQRITWMKHFEDDANEADQDRDNLWAYEGVVLPGGRIILGRWWYASDEVDFDNDYNGPFILWAVDEPDEPESDFDD